MMLNQFQDRLQKLGCTDKKILVAVSGGLDSVVLLDLLIRSGCTLAVAHANFQLRDEDSLGDEKWVNQLADKNGLPFYSRRFTTNNYATEHGLSIQMAARELRYAWFEELLNQHHLDVLATAHHLNDNLETFVINFTRGSGLTGLKGIPERNGKIVRPLLTFSREEIAKYATDRQLTWREDITNSSDDYARNFVRHQIIPKFRDLNPSIEETFKRNSERLSGSSELAGWALDQLHKTYSSEHQGQTRILKTVLNEFSYPAAVLCEMIRSFGFNLDQCHEIVLASNGQSGKQFLSATHQLNIDRDYIIIAEHQTQWPEVQIPKGRSLAQMGPMILKMDVGEGGKRDLVEEGFVLDLDKIQFPLLWRKWKPGDFFFPLGMDHKKKLSDFLIDRKTPLVEKENVTVLISSGDIVGVVGQRIDNRFKVSESTRNILRISVSHKER